MINNSNSIELLFKSGDREKMKLAQKLCHSLRISYWVECLPCRMSEMGDNWKIYKIVGMSLNPIKKRNITLLDLEDGWRVTMGGSPADRTFQRVYIIDLYAKRTEIK